MLVDCYTVLMKFSPDKRITKYSVHAFITQQDIVNIVGPA